MEDNTPNANISSGEKSNAADTSSNITGDTARGGKKEGRALSSSEKRNLVREGLLEVTRGVCRHICLKGGSCRCKYQPKFPMSGLNTFVPLLG